MAWTSPDDPVDFDEAISWFRKRVPMSKADFDRLDAASKRKAFTVANVAQIDLINQVWSALDDATKNGTTLEDFKKSIGPELRRAWSGTVEQPAWRLETIFRTNLQLAYGAGRYKQATDPDVINDRPVWLFDAILDGRTSPICRACDGTKRPADDTWWQSHTPPLHHGCRSGFVALTEKQAGRITLIAPTTPAADGFGLAPGAEEWEPKADAYPAPLAAVLQQKQQAIPPAPPPAKMQAGVHVAKVTKQRGVAQSTADDLLESVDDPGLLGFLEKKPIASLSIRKQAKVGRTAVNGWYDTLSTDLEVGAARASSTFGTPFTPGAVHSISTSAATREDATKATLKHELGHHVHLVQPRSASDAVVNAAYGRALKSSTFITRYAKSSSREYFAESFAAYYLRRSELQAYDPNGFAMVEEVLTLRGVLP